MPSSKTRPRPCLAAPVVRPVDESKDIHLDDPARQSRCRARRRSACSRPRVSRRGHPPGLGCRSPRCPRRSTSPAFAARTAIQRWWLRWRCCSSLVLAAALASMVTAPLRNIASATRTMTRGDMGARVPGSRLAELGAVVEFVQRDGGPAQDVVRQPAGRGRHAKAPRARTGGERGAPARQRRPAELAVDAAGIGIPAGTW